MDLIRLIMEQLSPQLIGRIASALGLDRASTEKAISAVVPTLLSALVGLVSKSGGASRLATMLQQQDPDQVERVTSMIGRSDQQELIDHGTGSLASLLGNDALGSLTGALARFAGTGEDQAKSLLGMAAPLVMGVLGRQQRTAALDAAGLANLLTSQKDSIASALPSGLASLLSGTGLLEGVSDRLRDTGAAATQATQAAAARAQSAARGVPSAAAQRASAAGGSSMRWAWIVAAIVVLAGLAYYFVGGKRGPEMAEQATQSAPQATQQATEAAPQATQKTTEAAPQATQQATEPAPQAAQKTTEAAPQATQQATEPAPQAAQKTTEAAPQAAQQATGAAAPQAAQQATGAASQATQQATGATSQATPSMASLTVGDVDLGQRINTVFDDTKKTLEGVTDAASAEAAKPKLQEIAGNLDQITELAGQLPADGKQALTGMVNNGMPAIRELIDKVMAMPGVGEVLKTTLEPIKTKLEGLATA
jgi:chemotaxis protein histidine kinase CheA